ncbi:type II toxin-antitoxin system VapC family toxin [Candidatus Woesearchaeota archaeon]|nr:type II toxin-antitoxin system VapC family toxin [Candidatus Woesearchaeota archaeon]MBI2661069.1 type II toxin-antitoxin system VapC family toxin [Candidatus Woesearchaeota archaeon]
MICLDTAFIIDFLKNKPEAVKACSNISDEQLATTAVNIFEIVFGILRKKQADHSNEFNGLMNLLNNTIVLNLNYNSSVKASEIASDLVRKGQEIESHDCLIAGIMRSNDCSRIITRDMEHFKRIEGIKVITY